MDLYGNSDKFYDDLINKIEKRLKQKINIDELGSGITNITKYLPYYSKGAKPSFIEDSMFTTIISLTRTLSRKVHDKLRDKILHIIEEKPEITIPEIAEITDKSERGIIKNIEKLRAEGILDREGSRKTGKWVIKEKEGSK